MDDIIKKLHEWGISKDIIEQLKVWLGNTFETELITNWFKISAEKIGIDTSNLPNVDLTSLTQKAQEFIKNDFQKKIWILVKIKNFFGGK